MKITIQIIWNVLNKYYPCGTIGAKMKEDMNMIEDTMRLVKLGYTEDEIINIYQKQHEEI